MANQRGTSRVTSSSTRSKRQAASKAKVSGAKPSNRANRQAASTAKVTSDSSGGRGSGSGAARVTQGRGKPPSLGMIGTRTLPKPDPRTAPKPRFQTRPVTPEQRSQAAADLKARQAARRLELAKQQGKANVQAAQARRAARAAAGAAAGKAVGKAVGTAALKGTVMGAVAGSVINAGPVAKGGLAGKPVRPARPKPKPSVAEKATNASFDKSFQRARQAGSSVFMFRGKRYTTKRRDGK